MKLRSLWKDLTKKSNHREAAIYKIRLVDEKNKPVPIERFLCKDEEAVLCIGSTNNMERRLTRFKYSRKTGKGGHSEASLMFLLEKFCSFKQKYKNYKLQYRFWKQKSEAKTKKEEEKLIKKYIKRFGEVPPLNSAIPNKRGYWNSY